ncbi:hypothetical protein B0H65DRAFT_463270 [Neurospora tetraspora]|uniref:Uncharacterized protein n=1 Tax=Neurospora tetraspora TaxID=94610 RepID=A0AAE0JIC3_9PEZI|nr:hypothetical protein B0H65DRAFT_463270 [Neurospora tetraspora]
MSRTSRTLTNTDLAFLLCTTAGTASQTKGKVSRNFSLSFETDYGLVLSLKPDDSITIALRKPPPAPQNQYIDPFDSATPIQSQRLYALSPVSPVSVPTHSHGSIDGVLFSPLGLVGTGGATITPARQSQNHNQTSSMRNIATSKSNSPSPKIKYYIRPGLDAKCSSHMYYTASASVSAFTQPQAQAQHQPQPQHQHQPSDGSSSRKFKLRLHRVKESHLQSLYHHPSPSPSSSHTNSSNSWFDSYLDWIDRLEDACALAQQRQRQQHEPQTPTTPCTAVPLSPTGRRDQAKEGSGPFTDEGEKSLWLVEGLLLASWLSLQEGVEGVEYVPLPSSEVYRLEHVQGNNAGVMMGRLLERIGAGE